MVLRHTPATLHSNTVKCCKTEFAKGPTTSGSEKYLITDKRVEKKAFLSLSCKKYRST
jgi:hypothetical protein